MYAKNSVHRRGSVCLWVRGVYTHLDRNPLGRHTHTSKQNWIISIRSRFIQLLVIWLDPTHWPTDPPNYPHTHPWVGVSQQMINLQTEFYLDSVNIFKIFSVLTWPHPSTHPSTHPPTNYTPTHGWGILHRFQIFKRNWNISISSSVIEF